MNLRPAYYNNLILASHNHRREKILAKSTFPLRPHLRLQDLCPLSTTIHSQQTSSLPARGEAPATTSGRPQREAAIKARMRFVDTYALSSSKQDPDLASEAIPRRRSAPRLSPIHSDDSSDSDVSVDDSESDCPRPSKAALGKKRKRSASPVMDDGEGRKSKAGKSLEMEERKRKEGATGFMVKSGSVMRNILQRKASRVSRESSTRPWEVSSQHLHMRRAGLNDMGPDTGSYLSGWRDEVRTKAPKGFAPGSKMGGARGPVGGNRYRASRFQEHL
ncbi:MAG: hypothetical protein Q9175_004538 [Cornicularia normoerica]